MQFVHVSTELLQGGQSHQNQQLNQLPHQDQDRRAGLKIGKNDTSLEKTHEVWM